MDGDKAGRNTYRSLSENYHMEEERILRHDVLLTGINDPTIESLVFNEDFYKCEIESEEIGKSIDKKVAAQTFANHVFDGKSISKETENSFKTLFGELR